jgi:KDO2-lipid IV(A) lauroyltransferase
MYHIVYGILYLFSLLPMALLHGISSFAAWLVWNVFGYRKDVVMGNLAIAFPEKTEQERIRIAKAFYLNFTDAMVESIKLISISEKDLLKRFIGQPGEIMNQMMDDNGGRNLQLHAMHNFNWEIAHLGLVKQLRYPFLGVYGPISNPIFEKIFYDIRSRYGTVLIPAPKFRTNFKDYARERYILALVADQNPAVPSHSHWIEFFGRLTPWVTGPEKGARTKDADVVFGTFFKVKRGYYSFEFRMPSRDPRTMEEGELTAEYVQYVEECIRKRPDNYLWSHRRWKHAYNDDYATLRRPRKDLPA